ncbi:MAG TPA: IS3 family transposase [Egibacteraceae bacterium]|nr:IS3 family transposase [Egibacteraceae bacterium]
MYGFIEANKAAFSVTVMCRVLEVARSGYYAWRRRQPSARQRDDQRLLGLIRRIHADARGCYGSPRVHELVDDHDERLGVNRVARLMACAGIAGVSGRKRGPRTTVPSSRSKPPDLVGRDFTATAPNRLWLADITYLETDEGWLYLAVILDAFSRRIIGWATADHLRTQLPLEALEMALKGRDVRPGTTLVHHTDSGSQYLSEAYGRRLSGAQLRASAARSAYDNAMVESWFHTLKNELIHRHRWATRAAADLAVFSYIGWYNQRRRHSSLDMRSPVRYEKEETTPTLFSQA